MPDKSENLTNIPNSKSPIPNSIAVVGASARSAAFSVLRSGRKAFAADLFADADLARHVPVTQISQYPEGLVDWLAATECDAWLYTGALENRPDLVDRLAQVRPLLGNSGDVLHRCRDPLNLQTLLGNNGIDFPPTQASSQGLPQDGSWLCKTYRGSSGSGVWQLADKNSQRQAKAAGAVFQKCVRGYLASVVFAIGNRGTSTLGITTQWVGSVEVGAAKFQYAGSLGIQQDLQPAVQKQIEKLARVLAEQFQLRGLVGVDLLIEGDRLWVLEINPRYTASVEIVERNEGVSSIDSHIAACTGQTLNNPKRGEPSAQAHGKAILYAKQDIKIDPSFFAWAIAQSGVPFTSCLADIPLEGSSILRGQPILTLFATAAPANLGECLLKRVEEVESWLYGPF